MRKILAVIMDWAGTTVDFGSNAPVAAFLKAFGAFGVTPTIAETREFMGMEKREHIKKMFALPRISKLWRDVRGHEHTSEDADGVYEKFEPALFDVLENHTTPLPGVLEAVRKLRETCIAIARREALARCEGNARSLCLDLYDQWREMDRNGKWRFTSPTHIVRAFSRALDELEEEGGIAARHARYSENHWVLVEGMRALGFRTLLDDEAQSPIITSFLYPDAAFDFDSFYAEVKRRGFVLYPGKISQADTFRVGNIGEIYPDDIKALIEIVKSTGSRFF